MRECIIVKLSNKYIYGKNLSLLDFYWRPIFIGDLNTSFSLETYNFSLNTQSFSLENSRFSLENSRFSLVNSGFSLENSGFSLENPSFSLENSRFSSKTQILPLTPFKLKLGFLKYIFKFYLR